MAAQPPKYLDDPDTSNITVTTCQCPKPITITSNNESTVYFNPGASASTHDIALKTLLKQKAVDYNKEYLKNGGEKRSKYARKYNR